MSPDVPANSDVASIIAELPSGARLLAQIADRQRADTQISDVVAVLAPAPQLSDDLILAANTSLHGDEEPVDTLADAVARLGHHETFCLAGALAWRNCCRNLGLYGVTSEAAWAGGVFTGLLMRQLAPATGLDSRAAYLAGLLRSIGKVVLNELARRTAEMPPYTEGDDTLPQWEADLLGYANTDVAAAVLEVWRYPLEIATAVRCHYLPTADSPLLARLLNIAAGAADLHGYGFRGEEEFWHVTPKLLAGCSLEHESLAAAVTSAAREFARVVAVLGPRPTVAA